MRLLKSSHLSVDGIRCTDAFDVCCVCKRERKRERMKDEERERKGEREKERKKMRKSEG